MPRFQKSRIPGGRREQQVSGSLGRQRPAFSRANSVGPGAMFYQSPDSTAAYGVEEGRKSAFSREDMATPPLGGRSSADSETASASQRSTCSPSSLFSLTSPFLNPQQTSGSGVEESENTGSHATVGSTDEDQFGEGERSDVDERGASPYSFNGGEVSAAISNVRPSEGSGVQQIYATISTIHVPPRWLHSFAP